MSKQANKPSATITMPEAANVVALCIAQANNRQVFESSKGAALTAAHQFLDNRPGAFVELAKAAAAARADAGGKNAPKGVQAGYKLASRFCKVAEFLEQQGGGFHWIGETIGDKRTFSINTAERATRKDSDDAQTKAYAEAFQSAKGGLLAKVQAAELAEKQAADKAAADARDAIIAAYKASEAAAAAAQATSKRKVVKAA